LSIFEPQAPARGGVEATGSGAGRPSPPSCNCASTRSPSPTVARCRPAG